MFIYVDESGSFTTSPVLDSWNVVAAYVVPESDRTQVEAVLRRLKISLGFKYTDEVKLKDIKEPEYARLLEQLSQLESRLFFSAIDLGRQAQSVVASHQAAQVDNIRANRPRMVYEEGKLMIDDLASRVERLSPQLYTQFVVQIALLDQVFRAATLYFSQRVPATLGSFRWRIDEKDAANPLFEETMRHLAPGFLQSVSLRNPAIFVEEFDYRHFDRSFRLASDRIPKHLQETVGSKIAAAADLGKVFGDVLFVRSHDVPGVQVVDLLASGIRRVLRGGFADNESIGRRIGSLMVQRPTAESPCHLISLGEDGYASGYIFELSELMKACARRMLK